MFKIPNLSVHKFSILPILQCLKSALKSKTAKFVLPIFVCFMFPLKEHSVYFYIYMNTKNRLEISKMCSDYLHSEFLTISDIQKSNLSLEKVIFFVQIKNENWVKNEF
jgi:hypothetical protein